MVTKLPLTPEQKARVALKNVGPALDVQIGKLEGSQGTRPALMVVGEKWTEEVTPFTLPGAVMEANHVYLAEQGLWLEYVDVFANNALLVVRAKTPEDDA